MADETTPSSSRDAPHPWRLEEHNIQSHGYLSIVDATGNKICDFFPFAGRGGRGRNATLALARKILEWANARES
jgi:hypothetical protein